MESNPRMTSSRIVVGKTLSYYSCLFTFNKYSPWQQKELSYSRSLLLRSMLPGRYRACSWDTLPGCIHSHTYRQCLWTNESRIKKAWSINDWWKKRRKDKKFSDGKLSKNKPAKIVSGTINILAHALSERETREKITISPSNRLYEGDW